MNVPNTVINVCAYGAGGGSRGRRSHHSPRRRRPPCLDIPMCGGQQRRRRSQENKGKKTKKSFGRSVCVCPSQATFPLADLTNDGARWQSKRSRRRRSAKHFTSATAMSTLGHPMVGLDMGLKLQLPPLFLASLSGVDSQFWRMQVRVFMDRSPTLQ